jgi:ParB family chromosome partitioning protein
MGRGLAAILSVAPKDEAEELREVPVELIGPNPNQPRRSFDEDSLLALAESIRAQGVLQPVLVRPVVGGRYELIAGERRWRAAQRAGLHEVPAVIRDVVPTRAFEMAMVENLQREDLNPIEEAAGYQRLIAELGYTQESLASRVGKERSTITNALRLLRLPEEVRNLVIDGRVSMGHARALLGLETTDSMVRLARRVAAREMSVRQVEGLVRREREDHANGGHAPPTRPSASARDLAERLSRGIGVKVKVVEAGPGRGHLELHYNSLDELDTLIGRLLPS